MVESQIVILAVAGSNPVDHPTFPKQRFQQWNQGFSQCSKGAESGRVLTWCNSVTHENGTITQKVTPRKLFHVATCGRARVPIYRRRTPTGTDGLRVVNYSTGKRRFDSYQNAELATEAAGKLARKASERQVVAAAMTNEQAGEYAAAVLKLKPLNVGLLSADDTEAARFATPPERGSERGLGGPRSGRMHAITPRTQPVNSR